jgi:hypothetical protein
MLGSDRCQLAKFRERAGARFRPDPRGRRPRSRRRTTAFALVVATELTTALATFRSSGSGGCARRGPLAGSPESERDGGHRRRDRLPPGHAGTLHRYRTRAARHRARPAFGEKRVPPGVCGLPLSRWPDRRRRHAVASLAPMAAGRPSFSYRPEAVVQIEACDGRDSPASGDGDALLLRRRRGHEIGSAASRSRRPGAEARSRPDQPTRWPLVRGWGSVRELVPGSDRASCVWRGGGQTPPGGFALLLSHRRHPRMAALAGFWMRRQAAVAARAPPGRRSGARPGAARFEITRWRFGPPRPRLSGD